MRKFIYLFNLLFLLLFVVVHMHFYSGAIVISSYFLVGIVLVFTIKSKMLLSKKRILIYVLIVAVAFWALLPNYTISESKEKVEKVYNVSIDTNKKYYYNTAPVDVKFNIASLLQTRRFYYFMFYKNDKQQTLLVNPMTNELINVNEEYWRTIDSQ